MKIPASILQDLQGIAGFDEIAFIAAHNTKPPVSVRKHPLKGANQFPDVQQVPWCPAGIYLPERPVFTLDPSFHAGAYYVQEASSMFLHHLLENVIAGRKNLRILDLCAAPGGKSTLIASMLDEESLLISNEVIRPRAAILEENISRWGYMNTWVTGNDPRDLGRLTGYFDIIVVDAPCSGSGLWRKDAAALNEWSEGNVAMCSARQQRILTDVWPALKEDGVLIYATCSYSPLENESILDWLATSYHVSTLSADTAQFPGISATVSPQKKMNCYRFFPGNVAGEGFFIAAMRKKEESQALKISKNKSAQNPKIQDAARHLTGRRETVYLQTKEDSYSAIMASHEADLQLLQKAVYIRKAGLEAGVPTAKEWLPAHDIALSVDIGKTINGVDVSRDQALRYLKREDMEIHDLPKGWYVVRYNGLGLGWIKGLGNRINNYLPKQWRIRMDIE